MDSDPVFTVRVHPDDDPRDPDARRIVKRAVTPSEWPWTRLTGLPVSLPRQHSDVALWPRQPSGDVALLMGHRIVLTGHEVSH